MRKIAILSHVVLDEVHGPGRTEYLTQIGGAGAYAAVGASLVSQADETLLVSGVGRRDRILVGEWARDRGIDPGGLFGVGELSPRTRIDYFDDGERSETPVFGLEHFEAHTPLPRHLLGYQGDLAATYLFHAHEEAYWNDVAGWRPAVTTPVLWEISRDSCAPEHLARVRELAELVDVLSLNIAEARALLGRDSDGLPSKLAKIAPVVVLRMGEHGSLIIDGQNLIGVPALSVEAVDPTGGGNSYSGAFLAAYAHSGDLEQAARAATAAAAVVVSVEGAPAVNDATRASVCSTAATITTISRKATA